VRAQQHRPCAAPHRFHQALDDALVDLADDLGMVFGGLPEWAMTVAVGGDADSRIDR